MKLLKKILLVFSTLVGVTALSLLALTRIINPDLIRDYVRSELSALTSQPSQIKGDIHWQIFPQPGIRLTDVEVGDESGKGPYTLKLKNLLFNLNVKPLFAGKLVFSEIRVNGFTLAINNSPALIQTKVEKIVERKEQAKPIDEKFAVEHLLLTNGSILFTKENKTLWISKLQLGTDQLYL